MPCIWTKKVPSSKKPGRGRPFMPESTETVGERGRHAHRRPVRANTVVRVQARIAEQGREEPGPGGRSMVEQVVVGIDVSKAKFDIAILPSGEQYTVSNDL